MRVFERKEEMTALSVARRGAGNTIGLVPTMGALHEGHASLIRAARAECDIAVVSIFVNPTQFGPGEDFERYPRTFEADRAMCEALGIDAIFAPSAGEMYPPDAATFVTQDRLTACLCGQTRPTHFRGVLTVVLKLFNIVRPHIAWFGQKDYQQTVVIRRMVRDLDVPVEVRVLPTVREADGVAMSSRNRHLSPEEREQARCLCEALDVCRAMFGAGERRAAALRAAMHSVISARPLVRIDYVDVVKPETLLSADAVEPGDVAVLAVYLGRTRLIDNAVLGA